MKICLIVYHKNATSLYPAHWLEQFNQSILNQTYKEFDIWENEYGGGDFRIFEKSFYTNQKHETFVDSMNYLLDMCFENGYDYVLNCNVDDFFSLNRVEKQLGYMKQHIDIISSNFSLIRDGQVIHTHHFDKLDIKMELSLQNNIICHPVIAISAKFWKDNRYVPSEVPYEDMLLWQRALDNGNTFVILPDVLCYHRLHNNSVCQNKNNR